MKTVKDKAGGGRPHALAVYSLLAAAVTQPSLENGSGETFATSVSLL
jgi:hypothetical protein